MKFITLDFETTYDKEYSLSKMTTEEYINDPRFQVIGYSIKVDEGDATWVTGSDEFIANSLALIDWQNATLLCHHARFDGAILAFKYGIVPAFYFDTLCMARALHDVTLGGSLAKLSKHYAVGEKGTEVVKAIGKRREAFSPGELSDYGDYCKNDTELTYKIFTKMAGGLVEEEFNLIDLTIRMYTQPRLEIDTEILNKRLIDIVNEQNIVLNALKEKLGCLDNEGVRAKLASNTQFGALLKELGVDLPVKISPTTRKEVYALAKKDLGFIELCEHPDPFIQQLCAARLGVKSTIEASRIERFLGIASRNNGKLPVPLNYYVASTGRWGGTDQVNLQNIPTRDKDKRALKNSIVAPKGYAILNADSKQIEARVLAWFCGQSDVLELFRTGQDVYTHDAMGIYEKIFQEVTPDMRFVGKTARLSLGYGTAWRKLQHTLKTSPPGADLNDDACKSIVYKWRGANDSITAMWKRCAAAIPSMATIEDCYPLGTNDVVKVESNGIRLPNKLLLRYPNLRLDDESDDGWVYDSREGPTKIWYGTVIENICQALARIAIGWQAIQIKEASGQLPVLTVHDSLVYVAKCDDEFNALLPVVFKCMKMSPPWAVGLPLDCDLKSGISYGEC